jgi:hypothetical protein
VSEGRERIKADEARDPIAIRTLGAQAVVFEAHPIAHLIEQFFGLAVNLGDRQSGMHQFRENRWQLLEQADETELFCLYMRNNSAEFSVGLSYVAADRVPKADALKSKN